MSVIEYQSLPGKLLPGVVEYALRPLQTLGDAQKTHVCTGLF